MYSGIYIVSILTLYFVIAIQRHYHVNNDNLCWGAKGSHYFVSWERKFQGTKVPRSESSTYATFAPRSESTWEL